MQLTEYCDLTFYKISYYRLLHPEETQQEVLHIVTVVYLFVGLVWQSSTSFDQLQQRRLISASFYP